MVCMLLTDQVSNNIYTPFNAHVLKPEVIQDNLAEHLKWNFEVDSVDTGGGMKSSEPRIKYLLN